MPVLMCSFALITIILNCIYPLQSSRYHISIWFVTLAVLCNLKNFICSMYHNYFKFLFIKPQVILSLNVVSVLKLFQIMKMLGVLKTNVQENMTKWITNITITLHINTWIKRYIMKRNSSRIAILYSVKEMDGR